MIVEILKNLRWAESPEDKEIIALYELKSVGAHQFEADTLLGLLRVNVMQLSHLEIENKIALSVVAEATLDGAHLVLDLPFIYINPPICIYTAPDEITEDAYAALHEILIDTIGKGASWPH